MAFLDLRKRKHAYPAKRVRDELIVWLTTGGRQGQPQSTPVWFWWDGEDVVVFEGRANVVGNGEPATSFPEYIAKYRRPIASYGWTHETFAADYAVPVVVRPTRVRVS
jgi:hypothetical protein